MYELCDAAIVQAEQEAIQTFKQQDLEKLGTQITTCTKILPHALGQILTYGISSVTILTEMADDRVKEKFAQLEKNLITEIRDPDLDLEAFTPMVKAIADILAPPLDLFLCYGVCKLIQLARPHYA